MTASRIAIALSIVLLNSAAAAPTASEAPAESGKIHLTFDQRSSKSTLEEFARRSGATVATMKRDGRNPEYDIASESFEAYIPTECRAGNEHGLLVWISAGPARIPAGWLSVLDRQKLIWISANNTG